MEKIPALKEVVEPHKGKQFTPADPLVIAGIINEKMIVKATPVNVNMDLSDLDKNKGYLVRVTPNPDSKIKLIEEIDVEIFKNEVEKSFKVLAERIK